MLINNPKLKVSNITDETRQLLSKDGQTKINRRIVNILIVDADAGVIKVTAFDPSFPLPKVGDMWTLPTVKKYECFDGLVQNVMV